MKNTNKARQSYNLLSNKIPNTTIMFIISFRQLLTNNINHKKLQKQQLFIYKLSNGLKLFPESQEVLMMRANIYVQLEQFQKAIIDYQIVGGIKGYFSLGNLYMTKHQYENALESFVQASKYKTYQLIKLKIGICQYYMGNNPMYIFNGLKINSSEIHYYKGLYMIKIKNYPDAYLSLEQAVKINDSKIYVTRSLIQLCKIKITERDFYQALYILQRIQNVDVEKKIIEKLKSFIEGVLSMMKRKFKQAMDILQNLDMLYQNRKDQLLEINNFINRLYYLYRGYGYFCIGEHKKTLEDYSKYQEILHKQGQNDLGKHGKLYNQILCKGIIAFNNEKFEQAFEYFTQANKQFPNKVQPYFYRAINLIKANINSIEQKIINSVITQLQKGLQLIKSQSNNIAANLYYHKSILNCFISQWSQGIGDIQKAIQKSEDNVPKFFFIRGLAFSCCNSFKQAIKDFTICINLDQQFADAYLQRSKCLQSQGKSNQAFIDLQRYITLNPQDQNIHKYAGHLLFQNGSYQDCILAYQQGLLLNNDADLVLTRAKAYLFCCEFLKCIQDLDTLNKQGIYDIDIKVLRHINLAFQKNWNQVNSIREIIDEKMEGELFKLSDIYIIIGYYHLYAGQFSDALQNFIYSLYLKQQVNHFYIDSESSMQDQQQQNKFNLDMIKYNIVLTYLLKKDYTNAMEFIFKIRNQKQEFKSLIKIIQKQIQNQFCEIPTSLVVFSQQQKFNNIMPTLDVHFQKGTLVPLFNQKMRPSFCFPKIQSPQLNSEFSINLLYNFNCSEIENKPEAPWIRRGQEGIIFTNNIQFYEGLQISTQNKSKFLQKQKKYFCTEEMQYLNEDQSQQNIEKMKMMLRLDKRIQQKLNRVLKNVK